MSPVFHFTQTEHDAQVWGARGGHWASEMATRARAAGHRLVDDPEAAEIILFWEPHQDSQIVYAPRLRAHPLVAGDPDKVCVVSVEDQPLGFLPGLYCSLPRSRQHPLRHRSWVYPSTPNPHIDRYRDRNTGAPSKMASFVGADSHPVRRRLFAMADSLARAGIVLQETGRGRFNTDPDDPALEQARIAYIETILDARFSLCPRGHGCASFRLQESMALGRAPVIISDEWAPVHGPDWDSFAIFVAEQAVAHLPEILAGYADRWQEMGTRARAVYDAWFGAEAYVTRVLEQIAAIHAGRRHDRDYRDDWAGLIDWAVSRPELAYALGNLGREVGR